MNKLVIVWNLFTMTQQLVIYSKETEKLDDLVLVQGAEELKNRIADICQKYQIAEIIIPESFDFVYGLIEPELQANTYTVSDTL